MRYLDGLRCAVETPLPGGGRLALHIANGETLHLTISPADDFEPAVSYAVRRTKWEDIPTKSEQLGQDHWRVTTPSLTVDVWLDPVRVLVRDGAGVARFDTAPGGVTMTATGGVRLSRALHPGEAVYGLGEHGETFNRNPGRYTIWNCDDSPHHPYKKFYCGIPFGIGLPGGATGPHAFFLDNPGRVQFDIGMTDPEMATMETTRGDLRLWLFFEDTPADLLFQYTALTGRMERPPLWALGYQQCRYSYETADRVREVAAEFRRRRIPCDVIYLDIDYMDRYRVFTWHPERFPDPTALMEDLASDGFSPVCIIDPGIAIAPGYAAYDEGLAQPGFFIRHADGRLVTQRVWPGNVHFPDFTHPDTRTTWGQWVADALLAHGVAGTWNDMNEPAVFSDRGNIDFPADAIHHDLGQHRTHDRVHNIYGMEMARASQEGQRTHAPALRPFVLTRSGWAGIQRHAAVWTGDNTSSFASMALDISLNLSMGMSGVPFVGCDIGGFGYNVTPELWSRWIEWGVMQPFCRAHSSKRTDDHEPWSSGPAAERVSKRMIELRYQLLPYFYSQFVEAVETGLPVKRPLILEYPFDATVMSIGDQFLVGADIMVAPILTPGHMHRVVYFPAGEWVHLWTDRRHAGGRWEMVEAPFGQPPIFIRAGAVIPMHPIRQHTSEPWPETTYLDVWPAPRLGGRLVEDDGTTQAWADGEEARTIFSGTETDHALTLTIGAAQGRGPAARTAWVLRLHRRDRRVAAVTVNGDPIVFDQQPDLIAATIPTPATPRPLTIRVEYEG